MGSKPDGGPAFPTDDYYDEKVQAQIYGMTLRDWFAGQALPMAWQMECDAPTGPYKPNEIGRMEPTFAGAATRAYYLADAMLKEREK